MDMWTSERWRRPAQEEAAAELGAVTLGGDPAGVTLGGERRWLNVYAPGGYSWRPAAGDRVLVLKAGGEREMPCLLGKAQTGAAELGPGEVCLQGGSSKVLLGQAALELGGRVMINGMELDRYIREIVTEILAAQGE